MKRINNISRKATALILASTMAVGAMGSTALAYNTEDANSDSYHPNNSYDYATTLNIGTTMHGVVDSEEEMDDEGLFNHNFDIYKFTVPATGTIKFKFNHENYVSQYRDLEFCLRNQNYESIDWSNGKNKASIPAETRTSDDTTLNAKAGNTYYIMVGNFYWDGPGPWAGETYTIKSSYIVNKPTISDIAAGKNSIKVTHSISASNTGYQVSYKESSASEWTNIKAEGAYSKSTAIKGLSSKTAYQVKVRAYLKAGNKTYFSNWSKAKTIATK